MSPETTSIVVGAVCAVTCLAFWVWLVAVPVARSFDGRLRRSIAVVLSAYTLVVGLALGTGIGLGVAWQWDRLAS